jgi:hypothetical protein
MEATGAPEVATPDRYSGSVQNRTGDTTIFSQSVTGRIDAPETA